MKMGTGEKYLDKDGAYKFKDLKNLIYNNAIPKVDCVTVPDKLKTDYSKVQ